MLGERHKSKDTLGVYDTSQSYRLVRVRQCFALFRRRRFNLIEITAFSVTFIIASFTISVTGGQHTSNMGRAA